MTERTGAGEMPLVVDPCLRGNVQTWLQELFPHARGRVRLMPLAADASTRRYLRAAWDMGPPESPASVVIMVCDPWEEHQTPAFLAVARHLRASNVHVPQIYGVLPSAGLVCLEDYGDWTLAAYWQQATQAERLLWGTRAIDELVKMHTVGTVHLDASCPAFHLAFDVPKLLSELQFFCQHAIEGLWQHRLVPAEREAFTMAATALCTVLASQPRYFCHRDYHGWNIMVHGDAVGILDFQDARLGPQPYDLVSLLTDRGTPGILGAAVLRTLQRYYVQRVEAEQGSRIDRESFQELYELAAVQRGLKAIGTFAYLATVRYRRQYLEYIPPTLAYLRPLLRRYALLKPLTAWLERYIPALG